MSTFKRLKIALLSAAYFLAIVCFGKAALAAEAEMPFQSFFELVKRPYFSWWCFSGAVLGVGWWAFNDWLKHRRRWTFNWKKFIAPPVAMLPLTILLVFFIMPSVGPALGRWSVDFVAAFLTATFSQRFGPAIMRRWEERIVSSSGDDTGQKRAAL
ncbi:MAG: hypothetical protein A2754_01030 [Candidatus Magasanikbacteria bacterium RIFCSPHIGHO2_01_FULL_47_8]|uniref:Uncharacterized protein n=1 Tax=Candidatus Magasanikbacteria bacterium RIFCSPHIGHO2_01_FULL_47_8 TaxID=1798673 RepID=A0A1F6MCD2_9BACT|nr:MAG: hypothetical protein A2754_01030 [Candidatus Magasanikbacteria bacterium RIFCSPHIGHO2_01_FULL_47_8]